MSERLSNDAKHEKAPTLNEREAQEQLGTIAEKLKADAEKAAEKAVSQEKHEVRKTIEKEAISGKEMAPGGSEKKSPVAPKDQVLDKEGTYQMTMQRIEGQLPGYQRRFSRVINNRTVDRVSNVAGKTIARPSGLLGGGVVAFIALVVVSIFARQYGWRLSGSEFVVFVLVGWALGISIDVLTKPLRRSSKE